MPGAASTGAYCVVREHRMRSGNAADGRSWTGVRAAAGAAEQDAQLVLSSLQTSTLVLRELSAGAIDVEGEHRHGGTERRRLPPAAALGGAFQGTRNLARVIQGKHAWFEIQGIAGLGDALRPLLASGRGYWAHFSAPSHEQRHHGKAPVPPRPRDPTLVSKWATAARTSSCARRECPSGRASRGASVPL